MITRTTALRVLFLFTAFLAHGNPSYAASPDWQMDCDSHCEGNVRIHECTFYDAGYGSVQDAGSVCNWIGECYYGGLNCTYQTENAVEHFGAWCDGEAIDAGDYFPWYVMDGCVGYDGTAEGSFYCSYTDSSCN